MQVVADVFCLEILVALKRSVGAIILVLDRDTSVVRDQNVLTIVEDGVLFRNGGW